MNNASTAFTLPELLTPKRLSAVKRMTNETAQVAYGMSGRMFLAAALHQMAQMMGLSR
jgi:hypothetical protein